MLEAGGCTRDQSLVGEPDVGDKRNALDFVLRARRRFVWEVITVAIVD